MRETGGDSVSMAGHRLQVLAAADRVKLSMAKQTRRDSCWEARARAEQAFGSPSCWGGSIKPQPEPASTTDGVFGSDRPLAGWKLGRAMSEIRCITRQMKCESLFFALGSSD